MPCSFPSEGAGHPEPTRFASLQLLIQILLHSRIKEASRLISLGRELAFSLGVRPNPVGMGNKKTDVPGTYRPVGSTCPPCPISPACYARFGPVGIHQERATHELWPSLFSVAIALVVARKEQTLARLHVSGDIYCPQPIGANEEDKTVLDTAYIHGLISLATTMRRKLGHMTPFAWGYTQARVEAFPALFEALTEAGFHFVRSGYLGVGGAVIWPHHRVDELPRPQDGATVILCPAQTRGISCRECMLCPRSAELGLCILFHPHGRKAHLLEEPALLPSVLSQAY